ncbi:MAG TPA: DedA family protein [Myxococcota bacterium]|nr:DedA family protein [Myxococcota bacterium]
MSPSEVSWLVRGLDLLAGLSGTQAYLAVLGGLGLCGLGLPMPEDIILITAGYLAALGKFPLGWAIAAGFVGVLSGDAILFSLGRRFGPDVLRWRLIQRVFAEERLDIARRKIQENGRFICFIARFLPGLRSPIYLTAGAMGIPLRTYVVQDATAAMISVPFWVILGWWFGPSVEGALRAARSMQGWFAGGALLVVVGYVLWVIRKERRLRDGDPSTY